MTNKLTEQFWKWAEKELQIRRLSWYAVERQAGLSNAAISRRARQLLPPTFETCVAMAQVFKLSDEDTLRKAGLLKPEPKQTAAISEFVHLLSQLSEDEQNKLLLIARSWVEARECVC